MPTAAETGWGGGVLWPKLVKSKCIQGRGRKLPCVPRPQPEGVSPWSCWQPLPITEVGTDEGRAQGAVPGPRWPVICKSFTS